MFNLRSRKGRWALLAIAAGAAGLVFLVRPVTAPEAELENARQALKAASRAGARQYAPAAYREAERTFEAGWFEMARQKGRLRPLRTYALADSLLVLAARNANSARVLADDSLGRVEGAATAEIALFSKRLAADRRALDSLLTDQRAQRAWSVAQSALVVAERLADQRAYQDALDALRDGRESLDVVDALLSDYSNDETRRIGTWRDWVAETLSLSRRTGGYALIVDKSAHSLYLVGKGRLLDTYACELGRNPAYQKRYAGDGATPEGKYTVVDVKAQGSKYYKALVLDYPNGRDRERYAENKATGTIPPGTGPGGHIEIHGMGGRGLDWTDGCVALTDRDMDDIMKLAGVGTPVTIVRKSDRWP